jgi:hypothetical protein
MCNENEHRNAAPTNIYGQEYKNIMINTTKNRSPQNDTDNCVAKHKVDRLHNVK